MSNSSIAFIGGGNMARSLIGGLVARGRDPDSIRVAEPVAQLRAGLHADFGVRVFERAEEAAAGAGAWLLAVKPQVLPLVCSELSALAQAHHPVVLSIAAGITSVQIDRWLGGGVAVVRAMPNTPALVGVGVTGLYANEATDAGQRKESAELLDSVGSTVWVAQEDLINAVTAVSGSGPAYVFLLAEAMQAAGVAQGLPLDTARTLATQTLLGAATMLAQLPEPADVLRKRVTSPGGTTQAAIEVFETQGFHGLVERALAAAANRGRELSAAND